MFSVSSSNLIHSCLDFRLTQIGLSGTTPPKKGSGNCGRWNVREDHILLNPSYYIGLVQLTLSPARLQLDCSENVDEEAVEQWINEDSILECCEVLSEDDILFRVTCGSEETRNFKKVPESDEENLVTHQKLSHGDELVHTETLLNYLGQEDERTPAEKMILRNLRSIIRRRVNEKQKQTSIISFFTKQCDGSRWEQDRDMGGMVKHLPSELLQQLLCGQLRIRASMVMEQSSSDCSLSST
ncbi:hypothetical protein AVEN_61769-1 [Araneus ventricosus]|uniref:Uncharacterized protein n=1 Tax=Araneus ventricosus TaxID=182803 RepID=A0A4Y2LKJ9_ARAVE|nr:hypothetical protein AVEN_61769-1 [Araneus ventricosus]